MPRSARNPHLFVNLVPFPRGSDPAQRRHARKKGMGKAQSGLPRRTARAAPVLC
jgi:hypothetical protein